MTSKTFNPRKTLHVSLTRSVEATRGALRQALNEMGFGRGNERPRMRKEQPRAAAGGAAWQAAEYDPRAAGESAGAVSELPLQEGEKCPVLHW